MPRNLHEKKVVFESVDGVEKVYAQGVVWEEEHLKVRHYPEHNDRKFLHEDNVAGIYPNAKEIPHERVYYVDDIDLY